MKKIGYVIGFLVILLIAYFGHMYLQQHAVNRKLTTFLIQKGSIPESDIIDIQKIRYDEKPGLYKQFSKSVTTKKDYENWKKEIEKTGEYLNGDKVAKTYEPKEEDCEIQYYLSYDINNEKIDFQYVLSGYSIFDKKLIKERFVYPDIPYFTPPGS
jgi:cupin superfamily acireductone dioxygenase involved in methionine salvage